MTTVEQSEALDDYLKTVRKARERFSKIVEWHLKLHTATGFDLPYGADNTYINCNTYGPDDYNVVNKEATIAKLATVAKFASKQPGVTVKKDYTSSFELEVVIWQDPDNQYNNITISYEAKRDVVCTKRVVGTKVVPARVVPERVEEEIEWDCEPVSLLAQ